MTRLGFNVAETVEITCRKTYFIVLRIINFGIPHVTSITSLCIVDEYFGHALFQNHTHLAKQQSQTWGNQWNSDFCPHRQVYQSDFIAKINVCETEVFWLEGGVLELAMSIEACMLSWLEGGCLSTQTTPPALGITIGAMTRNPKPYKYGVHHINLTSIFLNHAILGYMYIQQ